MSIKTFPTFDEAKAATSEGETVSATMCKKVWVYYPTLEYLSDVEHQELAFRVANDRPIEEGERVLRDRTPSLLEVLSGSELRIPDAPVA